MWVIKLRRLRWEGHVAGYGGWERCIQVLVGKLEGNEALGRLKCKWEDNIKMIFRKGNERAWTGLFWIRTATGTCKCSNEPIGSLIYREFLN